MSKAVVAIHIAPSAVRIMEGSLQGGRLLTGGHAIVEDAYRFFTDGKLTRLRELVDETVEAMQDAGIKAKQVFVCYDNGMTVDLLDSHVGRPGEEKTGLRAFLSADVGKKNKKKKKNPNAVPDGVLKKSQNWGEYAAFQNDQELRGTVSTVSVVDRDLMQGIVYEFAERGYKVKTIESPQTSMMYLRHANPYSYDNLAAILLYVQDPNEPVWVYTFMKNTPARAIKKPLMGQSDWSLEDRIVATCQREVASDALRRPIVMLGGDVFAQYQTYDHVADALVKDGFAIFDLYDNINDLNESDSGLDNALRIEVSGERSEEQIVCGRYTICMALLLRLLDKKPDNLMDLKDKVVTKAGALSQSVTLLVLGGVLLVGALGYSGFSLYRWKSMESKLVPASSLEYSLSSIQSEENNLSKREQLLNATDTRYSDIMKFISGRAGGEVNVASVDTVNMFEAITSDSQYVAVSGTQSGQTTTGTKTADGAAAAGDGQAASTGDGQAAATVDEKLTADDLVEKTQIVIRGYATSSAAAKNFYNALVGEKIGTTEMVGLQCVSLKDLVIQGMNKDEKKANKEKNKWTGGNENVYVFEISVD